MATASALAVAAVPFLTTSAVSADAAIGPSTTLGDLDCSDFTVLQTTSPAASSYALTSDGVITSYRMQLGATRPTAVALKVGRAMDADADSFTVVGSSDLETPNGTESVFERSVRIPALAGDFIGFYAPGASGCALFNDAGPYGYVNDDGNLATGSTLSGQPITGVSLNIDATLEADADKDGYGDTTQDRCSTDATTQGACLVVPPAAPPAAASAAPPAAPPAANPAAFTATTAPSSGGKAMVGKKVKALNASPSNFTPTPSTVKVQWFSGNKKVKGATTISYRVTRSDIGKKLRAKVVVTGTAPTTTITITTAKVTG